MNRLYVSVVVVFLSFGFYKPLAAATISCPHANPADLSALTPPIPVPDTIDCVAVVASHEVRLETGRWVGTRSLPAGGGTYRFDERGRLLQVVDNAGNVNAITPTRQIVSVTASSGGTTQFVYSPLGRLVSVSGPSGLAAAFTYSATGLVTSVTDGAGQITRYVYDSASHLTQLVASNGAVTTFTYAAGRLLSVSDASGTTSLSYAGPLLVQIGAGGGTAFTYDSVGRLTTINAQGSATTYAYGSELLSVTGPSSTTNYSYNTAGQLVQVVNPASGTTTYAYDGGRVVMRQAPDGGVTTYAYDALGRFVTVGDAAGTTSFAYNSASNLASIARPGGQSISFAYAPGVLPVVCPHADPSDLSALGPPIPAAGTGDCQSDVLASNVRVIDGRWSRLGELAGGGSYRLSDNGVLLDVADAEGNLMAIPAGRRLVKVIDFAGRTTRFTYDGQGRVLTVATARSTVSFTYSPGGRITQAIDGAGSTYRFVYDASQHLTGVINPVGAQAGINFSGDHVTAITDAMGASNLTYSASGDVLSIVAPSGRSVTFSYDQNSRLVDVTDAAGRNTDYVYNDTHLVAITAPGGNVNYSYAGDLLVSASGPEGVTSYTYANGLLASALSPAGLTTYSYNPAGRLTGVQTSVGNVAFVYDSAGAVTSVVDRRSRVTTFAYDDGVPPTLHLPSAITADATSTAGALVAFIVTASDTTDPDPVVTCAPASGSTFAVGTTTVPCRAVDAGGNQSTGTFTVTVRYSVSGLLRPFEPGDGATIKVGSTIPVKVQLTGASSGITDLAARFYYAKAGGPFAGGDLFKYDPANNQYVFNWMTRNLSAGVYTIRVDLGGGQVVSAQVTLVPK